MKSKIAFSVALGLSSILSIAFAGEPPSSGTHLPGGDRERIVTYWVAPYVQASERLGETKITWITEDGRIRQQADVSGLEPGYIFPIGHMQMVEGINEAWKIILPPEPKFVQSGGLGFTTSTPDSRVFLNEIHPKPGWITLDLYVHGQLAREVGPFPQYKGGGVQMNDDGSTALIVWKDESKTTAQLVTTGSNGALRLRVDCDNPVYSPIAAPDGAGALVRPNDESGGRNTFMWYTQEGKVHSLDISPNPHCLGWIPGTHQALFWTDAGNKTRHYRLVDWDTGKQLWDISGPGNGDALAVGITPKLIIFAVPELYQPGAWRGQELLLPGSKLQWIRTFYAVDARDGSIVSRWQAEYPEKLGDTDRDKFLTLNNKLFYITADEFTEINIDDILSKNNGWK